MDAANSSGPVGAIPLRPGDPHVVGPYAIAGRLGEGGMGAVFLGRTADGRAAAVKVIRGSLAQDEGFRQRFGSEVASAERVASFCTAQVLDHGLHDGHPYMATEYIEGPTLALQVGRHGALPPAALHGVAVGVAAALTAIHAAGLVHRDLKPSNVILSMSGPRVIDFGIARALDATTGVTRTGELIGSPGWMAPEQLLRGTVTTAADIFAWGCLVVFAARAEHPYGTGDFVQMAARIMHEPPDLHDLTPPLHDLAAAALAKDPTQRPTAQDLLLTLVGGTGPQHVTPILQSTWTPSAAEYSPTLASNPPEHPPTAPSHPQGAHPPTIASGPPSGYPATAASGIPGAHPPTAASDVPAYLRPPEGGAERPSRVAAYVMTGAVVALVAALAGLSVLLFRTGSAKGSAFAAVALGKAGHPTDIGRSVSDPSSVEVTANQPSCGATKYRGRTANGRFCLVPVVLRSTVEPVYGRAHPITVTTARQQLYDTAGRAYRPVAADGGDQTLAPGGLVATNLLFDVAKGATPARIVVYVSAKGVPLWI